jgi:tetratricopeptide (TPR) repeat protein
VIADLSKAIELKPDRYLLYDLRGSAHSMLGDREGVVADFAKAIALAPRHNVYLHRALAFRNLEDHERAIADLGKAIELKADYAYAYLNRGMIYKKLGQRDRAIADLRRTIELGTNRSWSERAKEHLRELGILTGYEQ